MNVVALAGGVGAARFLTGLVRVVDASGVTVVANTGDDLVLHGLHISPDLDTITYTLGGGINAGQGWGRAGETLAVATELRERYGRPDWFTLGDRDLATHLVRSELLGRGYSLTEATAVVARAWDLRVSLVPMTDEVVATRIHTADGRDLHFQEWWVGECGVPEVVDIRLAGAENAKPAPGVLDAIRDADAVLLCPSNPAVSIGTILAVPGMREALRSRQVVGVSPIIGGRVVRGMADRLLPPLGVDVSASGVAGCYADFLDGWVVDEADAAAATELRRGGLAVAVTDTVMRSVEVSESLARTTLSLCGARTP